MTHKGWRVVKPQHSQSISFGVENDVGLIVSVPEFTYSRLSLSRLRLSRIPAYLEVKFWSLF